MEKGIYVKDLFQGSWANIFDEFNGTEFYVFEEFPGATTKAQRCWVRKFVESWTVLFYRESKLILTKTEFLENSEPDYFTVRLTITAAGTLKKQVSNLEAKGQENELEIYQDFLFLVKKRLSMMVRREYPLSCDQILFDANVPVCICLKLWGGKWQEKDLQKFEDLSWKDELQKILAEHKAEFVEFSFLHNTRCIHEVDKNLIMKVKFSEEVSREQIDLLAEDLNKCFVSIKNGKKIEPKFLSSEDYPYVM